ncbi:hypothetical protein GCM10009097_06810 [Pigmentiphaga daeguensis]|uniref:Uncharacterized protein n=1 Tax=Pigmentiphaga daeguensis TaxID=414049 RepID=A0ABP3L7H5_9BURK
MTCDRCTPSTYRADCVACGVRLVLSAESKAAPKLARELAKGHLLFIERRAGLDVRKAVGAKLRGKA